MYEEPVGHERAGQLRYRREPNAYERFIEEEGVPCLRGIGLRDVRDLALAPWKRMGGKGAFIELSGTGSVGGIYVVEVPPRGALNPERHIYEEVFLVIEGRGTTEVWKEGSARRQVFEWQPGTLFSIPVNAWHRLVNATSGPALVLGASNAPLLLNTFQNRQFVFENPFDFSDRYDERDEYFKPRDELEPAPGWRRAMLRSNVIPDIAHCYLPLDNWRGPGYRWLTPQMAGNTSFFGFVAEYPSGRYSKAHAHASGAVLVCLGGKGYTYTWPEALGLRPWENGKRELVKRQDYIPGGMVSAAPGGGDWFHQHFGVAKDPLRVLAIIPGGGRNREVGSPGEEVTNISADIQEGGRAIPYRDEDPHIRREYEATLASEGVEFQMPAAVYQ